MTTKLDAENAQRDFINNTKGVNGTLPKWFSACGVCLDPNNKSFGLIIYVKKKKDIKVATALGNNLLLVPFEVKVAEIMAVV